MGSNGRTRAHGPFSHAATDVDKHPEHRKYVFPERAADPNDATHPSDEPAGLYDRQGRLKHPERSLYFDPVFNPYGAPPPGMPYREKPEYAAMRFAGPPMPVGPSRAEIEAFVPVADGSSERSFLLFPPSSRVS